MARSGLAVRSGGRAVAVAAVAGAMLLPTTTTMTTGTAAVAAVRAGSPGGIISTVAGGVGGPGPATGVALAPCAATSMGRSLYIGDDFAVRRVNEATGRLVTVAGDHAFGGDQDGASATTTALFGACGTTTDAAGNLLIAEGEQVRLVAARTGRFYGQAMTAGNIYTIAGQADNFRQDGETGDGGPATGGLLYDAVGVSHDRAGNLLIADSGEQVTCGESCSELGALVRVVAARTGRFYGQHMMAGDIYTIAGVQDPAPVGNGGLAASAWLGTTIGAVRTDANGNLVLADQGIFDQPPRVMTPSVRVIATSTGRFYGRHMVAGHIYRVAGDGSYGTAGDGGPATKASLNLAGDVVIDPAGNLIIAAHSRVRVVAARTGRFYGQAMRAGDIYRVAGTGPAGFSGDGGPATRAHVDAATVTRDAYGNVVLGGGTWVRVIAEASGRYYGRRMKAGDIYTVAGNGQRFSGDGEPARQAEMNPETGVAADAAGDMGIGDVYMVDVVMARSGTFFGRRMTAGDLYTVAGNGTAGYSGDGGPGRKALISNPDFAGGVSFDPNGNLVFADANSSRIRVVAVRSGRFYGRSMIGGYIYTIAGTGVRGFSGDGGPATQAKLNIPESMGVDRQGNVFITDINEARVRVVAGRTATMFGQAMKAGDIYTVLGPGAISGARIYATAVAADAAGNLILTDGNQVFVAAVRSGTFYGQAMTAGHLYLLAGNGKFGQAGSGGPALQATLGGPEGVAVDRIGNVAFAAQTNAGVVWVVAERTGTFYGQAMTAGDIYIVAGGGSDFLADGRPAPDAEILPNAVASTPDGGLLATDQYSYRVRGISP